MASTSPAAIARLLAASDSCPLSTGGADTPYLGPLSLCHVAGRKGRCYVASADVAAGTLLLVEPALVSTGVLDAEDEGGQGPEPWGDPMAGLERRSPLVFQVARVLKRADQGAAHVRGGGGKGVGATTGA